MNKKYIISGIEFEVSDEKIEYGDFFVDIKSDETEMLAEKNKEKEQLYQEKNGKV